MKKNILSLFITMTISFSSYAAQSMKPGLWEHSFTMKSASGKVEKALADMKKQLAAMPADQRKMMEEMMAKQGLGLGKEKDKANLVKICISKEQAEKMEFPHNTSDRCNNEITKRSDNTVESKFTCTGSPRTEGTATFTLISSTTYTGKALIDVVNDGKTDRMVMDSHGKWLSSDCGSIKPYIPKK